MSRLSAFAHRLAALPQPGSVALNIASNGIARLTLQNASRRNALSGPMMAQFAERVDELSENKDAWAVILSGDGGHFCAGADLDLALEHITTATDAELMSQLMTSTLNKLRSLPLLSISAIDGNAVGGGAEVCTATDWRVMGAKARVQFVQTRMGASTGWGGAARLSEIVGNRSTALSLLLHQPRIDANAAVACRLADAVAAEGEPAAAEAERLLLKAFECAATPNAIKAIKTAVAAATPIGPSVEHAETEAFATTWGAPANREALAKAAATIQSAKK